MSNRVVVGSADDARRCGTSRRTARCGSRTRPTAAFDVLACRCARTAPRVPARATVRDGRGRGRRSTAGAGLRGVAPGQSAVLYDGTRVLGQATVTAAQPRRRRRRPVSGGRPGVTGTGPWPGLDVLEAQTVVVGDLVDTPSEVAGLPVHRDARRARALGRPHRPRRRAARRAAHRARAARLEARRPPGPRPRPRAGATCARTSTRSRSPAHGWSGPLVVPVLGPMTLAASLYLVPRRPGGVRRRRASASSPRRWPPGVAEHLAAIRRSVPGARARPCCCTSRCSRRSWPGCCPSFSGYSRAALRPRARRRRAHRRRGRRGVRTGRPRSSCTAAPRGPRSARSAPPASTGSRSPSPRSTSAAGRRSPRWSRAGWRSGPSCAPQASSQCAGPDVAGQADTLTRPWRSVGLPMAGAARRRAPRRRHHRAGQPGRRPRRAGRTGAGRADRGRTSGGMTVPLHSLSVGRALALLVGVRGGDRRDGAARRLLHRHRRDHPDRARRTTPTRASRPTPPGPTPRPCGTPSSRRRPSAPGTSTGEPTEVVVAEASPRCSPPVRVLAVGGRRRRSPSPRVLAVGRTSA